ncbi:MAG TPA: xanthine dehydrogenase family protein molybdopterin-binding subunit [Spongiibacteraceae bacterium]
MSALGAAVDRSDGVQKVTGAARYSAEFQFPRLAHAVLVTSTIPSGRIAAIDSDSAQRMPGVIAILTYRNAPKLPVLGEKELQPPAGRALSLLQSDRIYYNGQPIAVVVAETLEQAQAAARQVQLHYTAETAQLDFAAAKNSAHKPDSLMGEDADSERGAPDAALRRANINIDAIYTTPIEHHNPMEPHATIAAWDGDRLTVCDATQYVDGVKNSLAKVLGVAAEKIRVICHYTGGGFGCKGSTWSHVPLAAMAAKKTGRPIKLVLERTQMFGPVGARPVTEQHIQLGADANGKLLALRHDVIAHTSTFEDWTEPSAIVTRMLYACPHLATSHRLAALNLGTPTFMRAPGEASGTFALETAMDELAYAVKIDPLELRLRNYAETDPEKNLPFSSKSLRECYRVGAEKFGWSRRKSAPRSMRAGKQLIGWGMATATYPVRRSEANARALLRPDGFVYVSAGSHDLGTGTYTIMTQIAATELNMAPTSIRAEIGDTQLPRAPVSGGSQTAASVGPAVQAAARALREQIIQTAIADTQSPLHGVATDAVECRDGWLIMGDKRDAFSAIVARRPDRVLAADAKSAPGDEKKSYSMHSFGAIFAEVHIDEELAQLQVARLVGAYAVGNLLNAKTGRSQLLGGIVGGVGMALFEQSLLDPHAGRFINNNLAEYHVPVNADIQSIDIAFVPEEDRIINPLGAKGIGELGITGAAAAIGNAVFHATGRRIRDLPITPQKLIA